MAKKVALGTALLQLVLAVVIWFAYSVPAAEAGVRFQLRFAVDGSRPSAPGSPSASTASRWS